MNGLIVIDKPRGLTSHDVVFRVRSLLAGDKTGHCGTLDPDATGLLLVTVGQATRFFPFLSAHDKTYQGTIRFGFSTDTYDASGRPTSPECREYPERQVVAAALKTFEGRQSQCPPAFSARKQNGRPLYELARRNKDVVLEPRGIVVHRFVLGNYAPPDADFEAECSAGTYIRSLAHDLGQALGCGAHLTRLRRTASGSFHLKDALSLENVESLAKAGRLDEVLRPIETLLTEFPAVTLGVEGAERARHGNLVLPSHGLDAGSAPVFPFGSSPVFRLLDADGRFLGLARRSAGEDGLCPFLVVAG